MLLRAVCLAMLVCVLGQVAAIAGSDPNPDFVNALRRGRAEYLAGHFVAAESSLLAALRTLRPFDEVERAVTLAELGDVYLNEDQLAKAERAYLDALAIYKKQSDKKAIPLVLRNLGAVYSWERRHDDALRTLEQALKLTKLAGSENAVLRAQIVNSLGVAYFRLGKNGKAEDYFNQALQIASTIAVPFDTAELMNNLGAVNYAKRNFRKSEELLKNALEMTQARVGPAHPDLIFTLSALGVLYTDMGRYQDAVDQYERALKIVQPDAAAFDTRIARLLHGIAMAYRKAGKTGEAIDTLAQATVIARRNLIPHPDMVEIIDDYSTMLKAQGKTREAEELRVEANRARVRSSLVINAHNPF